MAPTSIPTGNDRPPCRSLLKRNITQMGLGLFILLFVTAYTANLTTFLVNRDQQGAVSDIQGAIDRGLRICGTEMGSSPARAVYPAANWIHDPNYNLSTPGIKRQADVLKYLRDGICDVAVIDYEDLRREHMKGVRHSVGLYIEPHAVAQDVGRRVQVCVIQSS